MKNTTFKFVNSFLVKTGIVVASVLFVGVPAFTFAATLNRELSLGMSGSDVTALQSYLSHDPSIYPQGTVTGYFGGLTKNAVLNYQSHNNIAMVGRVGPTTLNSLNTQIPLDGTGISMPSIYNVSTNVSRGSASVNWTTDESTRGLVYYSTSPLTTYEHWNIVDVSGMTAMTDLNFHNSQTVSISGLQPNTTYYYLVYTTDQDNNVAVTWPSSFHTTN